MPESAASRDRSAGRRHLVLLGAGAGHLHLLARLASQPEPGIQVTLVSQSVRPLASAWLPAFVAGELTWESCTVALEPLLQRSGVQRLARRVAVLDVPSQTVALDDGQMLHYNWLSVDHGPEQDRQLLEQTLPGARKHGLFLYPTHAFAILWPQVVQLPAAQLQSLAVIGAGPQTIELSLALRHRLPHSALTLVTGGESLGADYPSAMGARVRQVLRQHAITVLEDHVVCLRQGEVQLGCGARLACNVPVIAAGQAAPAWLCASGLVLHSDGRPQADDCQRSTSHAQVLLGAGMATGPEAATASTPLDDWRMGPQHAANLLRLVHGEEPQVLRARQHSLQVLAVGTAIAIAGWGRLSWRSRWLARRHAHALNSCLLPFASSPLRAG